MNYLGNVRFLICNFLIILLTQMTLKEMSIVEKKSSITLLVINPYGVALVIALALLFKYLINEVKLRIIKLEAREDKTK